ncbi:MAG TPA: hypothetical protein VGC55_09965 [Dokdonella sp.]
MSGNFRPSTRKLFALLGRHAEPVYRDQHDEVYRVHEVCVALWNAAYSQHGAERYRDGVWDADPDVIAALRDAMADHPHDYAGQDLAYTLLKFGCTGADIVAHLHPWDRLAYRWAEEGLGGADVSRRLVDAGASDGLPPAAIGTIDSRIGNPSSALRRHDDLQGHLFDSRLLYANLRDGGFQPGHDEPFARLAAGAIPPVLVEDLSQGIDTDARFKDVSDAVQPMDRDGRIAEEIAGIPIVSDAGAHWFVRYTHAGKTYGFLAPCESGWVDVPCVLANFNGFLGHLGRNDQAFRLGSGPDGDTEWAFFIVADGTSFPAVCRQLHIPLHP